MKYPHTYVFEDHVMQIFWTKLWLMPICEGCHIFGLTQKRANQIGDLIELLPIKYCSELGHRPVSWSVFITTSGFIVLGLFTSNREFQVGFHTLSSLDLKEFIVGAHTTWEGREFQESITLFVKKCCLADVLQYDFFNLQQCPLVSVKQKGGLLQMYLKTSIMSPLALLKHMLGKLMRSRRSSYGTFRREGIIFVALRSTPSMRFFFIFLQAWGPCCVTIFQGTSHYVAAFLDAWLGFLLLVYAML